MQRETSAGRYLLWASALLTLMSAGSRPGRAVEFQSGEEVVISADQVIEDDLYMTGDTMRVLGRVKGDVVAAGRMISIEGVVEGDLIAAGQGVVVNGEVQDDVRIAGMALKLGKGATVTDDVFAAGFSFESDAESSVGGKTGISGYQALIGGRHAQGLEASLVGLRIDGEIQDGVVATVESEAGPAWWTRFMDSPVPLPIVDAGLTVGEGARIEGDLEYRSKAAGSIAAGSEIAGRVQHLKPEVKPEVKPGAKERVGSRLRWLGSLLVIGSLLLWLLPDNIPGVADTLRARPAASLGWGFVTLLAVPLAMVLILVITVLLASILGMLTLGRAAALSVVLGLLTEIDLAALLWIAVAFLAPIIVAFALGRWLMTRATGQERNRFLLLLAGLVVLVVLGLIPFVGAVVKWAAILLGLGASALWSIARFSKGAV